MNKGKLKSVKPARAQFTRLQTQDKGHVVAYSLHQQTSKDKHNISLTTPRFANTKLN